jgi:purine-binding chemotaxis protein CheW
MENYSSSIPYLSFKLNQDLYAYKISDVVEVIDLQKITIIPKTPPYIMGVINFRGDILPLIDIRKECGLDFQNDFDPAESVIIVLDVNKDDPENRFMVGSIVNSVKDVVEVKPVDIMPIPNFDNRINPEFAEGIFKHGDDFITVLDILAVFSINQNS